MELIQNRADVFKIVNRIARNEQISDYTILDVYTNSKGEKFFGDICVLTLKSKQKQSKIVNLVLKLASQDPKIRKSAPIRITYENEIHFYTNVIPEFEKLQNEFGIIEKINVAPKCYAAALEEGAEILALENLKSNGFEIYNKALEFDYDHAELIFKSYARYHALSFALKHLKRERFEEICAEFRDVAASFKENFGDNMMQCREDALNALIPGQDDAVIAAYKKVNGIDFQEYLENNFKDPRYAVIVHGDAWSNNMLFKYKVENFAKIPQEMCFIDFQMIQKKMPFFDLSYSLYSGGSKEVYDKLDDLLVTYHKTCGAFLNKFDINIEEIFPFSIYKEEWKRIAIVGATISLLIQKLKCTKTEDIVDMEDIVEKGDMQQTKYDRTLYNKRVREILIHLYEIDAL